MNKLPIDILHDSELVKPDNGCENAPTDVVLDFIEQVVDAIDSYDHC